MATPAQDGQEIDCSISYDFNFVKPPPDRLMCKICQLPCRETQKSECCGHVFCKRDLEKMKAATAVSYACPICRIEPFKTYPDRAVDREIKGLKIYCRNKEVGCGWSGEMDRVDAHLNKCNVPCEYCKEVVHYTAMSSHINECPCYCQHCNTLAERDVINSQHMDKCRKFPVPCPNTCGKDKIPQDEIDEHMKECPLEMVWCEYYDVGCKTKLVREKMPAHDSEAMDKHLQYMHSVVRQLKKENVSLDNAKVVAEANMLENAEQIKELLDTHTLQQEAIAKVREDIIDLNEKHHKIKLTMRNRTFFLVSVIVLIFAVMIFYYKATNEKITLINRHMHTLSTTNDANKLHYNKLLSQLQENVTLLSQLQENVTLLSQLQENVTLHNNQLERVTEAIIEASANIETLKHYLISFLHHVVSGLKPLAMSIVTKLDILSELSRTVMLVRPVFKVPDYQGKIKRKENWTSSPFFAFNEGYQMCLKVYPAGIGKGAGDHVSIRLYLMKGPHDDKLQELGYWPLKGNFSIHLLDQLNKGPISEDSHITHGFLISDIKNSYRVTHNDMVNVEDLCIDQFVSHVRLIEPNFFSKYVNASSNGNLYFRVQYNEDDQPPYRDIYTLSEQLNIHKLSIQHALKTLDLDEEVDDQVAPVILKLSRFSKMKYADTWYSSPFFAFGGGYQMCLEVVKAKDCLVSLQLFLMKGPYDEKLQKLGMWPLRGTFTVKLYTNNKSYPRTVILDEEICTKCFKRVTKTDIAREGFGFSTFSVGTSNSCTIKGDALFFEVLYNKGTAT